MNNPITVSKGWWNHLGDSQNSNRVVAIFTLIIALTGIIYAVFAGLQWTATVQVMRLEQRPWMAAKGGQWQLQIGQPIARPTWLQNIGKTAALNVKATFRMEVVKEGDEPTFDLSKPNGSRMTTPVLWQGDVVPNPPVNLLILEAPTKPTLFSQDLNERYNSRKITFVDYGRITYDDIWGIQHSTTVCQSLKAPDPSGVIYTASKAEEKCTAYTSVDRNY